MKIVLDLVKLLAAVFGSVLAFAAVVALIGVSLERRQLRQQVRVDQARLARARAHFGNLPAAHREVLAGLVDVPWAALQCTWGNGAALPLWLLWLQSGYPDEEDWATFEPEALVHQYTAWTATAAIAPFLVRVALSPIAVHRREAMDALCWLTYTWNSSPTEQTMESIVTCLHEARPALAALREPELAVLQDSLLSGIDALSGRPLGRLK